jgi:hypothetical protein
MVILRFEQGINENPDYENKRIQTYIYLFYYRDFQQ